MTSCSKDEKDEVPENDVISFTINGPGLTNYEFETTGILGNIFGISYELSDVITVNSLTQTSDKIAGVSFNSDSPGMYTITDDFTYTQGGANLANVNADFTHNGIEYQIFSKSGTLNVSNVSITPISGGNGAGNASGHGTFSGTFVTFDDTGEEADTYQVTNGVFKFSKGM